MVSAGGRSRAQTMGRACCYTLRATLSPSRGSALPLEVGAPVRTLPRLPGHMPWPLRGAPTVQSSGLMVLTAAGERRTGSWLSVPGGGSLPGPVQDSGFRIPSLSSQAFAHCFLCQALAKHHGSGIN